MTLKSNLYKFLQHLLFWILIWLFQSLSHANYNSDFHKYLFIQAARLPAEILVVYFNIYFLLPKLLLKKKDATYLTVLFLSMIAVGFIQRGVVIVGVLPFFPEYCARDFFTFYPVFYDFISLYPVVTLTTAIKLVRIWYKDQKKAQELEKERLHTELKFLKTQIHPHFFFNTLNNLYALTLIKSDDAPEVVLKLSGLMDYLLYESNSAYVPLRKEIDHLNNYLALEKLRFGDRLDLKFNVSGRVEGKKIAPLLILPFLENTFKHGVRDAITQSWIIADLTVVDEEMVLVVENSISSENDSSIKEKESIGLKNVKRRLELLYPDNHKMEIVSGANSFKVELKLNLSYTSVPYEDKMFNN